MLLDPITKQPYDPSLYDFTTYFDIYDREETLGEELSKYDPNIANDRCAIINKYVIDKSNYLTYRHKYLLFKVLEDALNDTHYDFNRILEDDPDEYSSIAWDINDPRGFFEDILKIAKESWKDELYKASLEDPNAW
ncbi:hypothetical protein [Budvicia aquatica]|uniref:hypothetical protein n=1 Tax=Budvicia aquatica TaxID=82979 RepID=UPI00208B49A6|nr:hypothetical protein [Budvicia aquatica]GKX52722.1 hypothetical protein SOASR029_30310 [Budvicia aquatica]